MKYQYQNEITENDKAFIKYLKEAVSELLYEYGILSQSELEYILRSIKNKQ